MNVARAGCDTLVPDSEVDMRPASGRVKLLVDGAESPTNVSLASAGK